MRPAATETVAPAIPAPRGSAGSAWLKWLARRIGLAILTLWLCSVLVFFATAALGDPVRAILGKDYASSPERAAALAAALHLDQPVIVRYFDWLGGLLTGNLGTSIANGLPVGELVGPRIVNSAVLVSTIVPQGSDLWATPTSSPREHLPAGGRVAVEPGAVPGGHARLVDAHGDLGRGARHARGAAALERRTQPLLAEHLGAPADPVAAGAPDGGPRLRAPALGGLVEALHPQERRPRARRETMPVSIASRPSSACGEATSATSEAGCGGGALKPPVDCAEALAGSAKATATRAGRSRVRETSLIDAFSGAYEVS